MDKETMSVQELSTRMGISLPKAYALVKEPDFPVWKVECGYYCFVFLNRAEAMAFCEKRYKRVKGGSA